MLSLCVMNLNVSFMEFNYWHKLTFDSIIIPTYYGANVGDSSLPLVDLWAYHSVKLLVCRSFCLLVVLVCLVGVSLCVIVSPVLAALSGLRVHQCVRACVSSRGSWASSALLFQRNWRRPGGNCTPLRRLVKTSFNQGLLLAKWN